MKTWLKSAGTLVLMCAVGVGAGLLAARGYLETRPAYLEGDYSVMQAQTGQRVVLLGTSWCGYCAKTREYLDAHGIVYADLDVETSSEAEAWLTQLGAPGVPVMLIGNRQIRGYAPEQWEAALRALPTSAGWSGAP